MIFTLSGSIFLSLNTLSGSKITIVVLSEGKDLEIVYPFGSIVAEKDTRLGSKNGENDTLPSGTYPVPKILKCPPPGIRYGELFLLGQLFGSKRNSACLADFLS